MTAPRDGARRYGTGARDWRAIAPRLEPSVREALDTLAAEAGVATTTYAADVLTRHVALRRDT